MRKDTLAGVGMRRLFLLFGLFFAVVPANASTTINEILKICDTSKEITDAPENFSCYLFFSGIMQGLLHEYVRDFYSGDKKLFCPPDDVNENQIRTIIWRHIVNHPEKWHLYAVNVSVQAIQEVFPCPK